MLFRKSDVLHLRMLLRTLVVLLLMPTLNIRAQIVLSNCGAKNESLGSTSSVSTDAWSLWRNPAGLMSIEQTVTSSAIRRTQNISALSRSVVVATHTKAGSIAAGMSAFGDDIYNEQAASLGFANKLGLASLGIRADVIQLRIDGESTRRVIGISVGAIAKLSSTLSVGACAHNINLPSWARGQPLPVVLNAGLLFTPSESFLVIAEAEKNTDLRPTIKGAMEYSLRRKFFARTGFNLFPNCAFGGIGLHRWRFAFDYSLKYGYMPGFSQQLSISVQFGKLK
jgi:hypothetical protein